MANQKRSSNNSIVVQSAILAAAQILVRVIGLLYVYPCSVSSVMWAMVIMAPLMKSISLSCFYPPMVSLRRWLSLWPAPGPERV